MGRVTKLPAACIVCSGGAAALFVLREGLLQRKLPFLVGWFLLAREAGNVGESVSLLVIGLCLERLVSRRVMFRLLEQECSYKKTYVRWRGLPTIIKGLSRIGREGEGKKESNRVHRVVKNQRVQGVRPCGCRVVVVWGREREASSTNTAKQKPRKLQILIPRSRRREISDHIGRGAPSLSGSYDPGAPGGRSGVGLRNSGETSNSSGSSDRWA
jgi:hypothetical protein